MKKLLYIDDLRTPCTYIQNHYKVTITRSYQEAINLLEDFTIIDLDHDLGEEKTGYDICKYIVENNIKITRVYIHSSNPVGRFNMYQLLHRYCKCDIIPY